MFSGEGVRITWQYMYHGDSKPVHHVTTLWFVLVARWLCCVVSVAMPSPHAHQCRHINNTICPEYQPISTIQAHSHAMSAIPKLATYQVAGTMSHPSITLNNLLPVQGNTLYRPCYAVNIAATPDWTQHKQSTSQHPSEEQAETMCHCQQCSFSSTSVAIGIPRPQC